MSTSRAFDRHIAYNAALPPRSLSAPRAYRVPGSLTPLTPESIARMRASIRAALRMPTTGATSL